MKRLTILAALFGLCGIGCGGDPREVHVNNVLTYLNNTSSHLSQVKKRLSEVVKKEKVVDEDVKEVNDALDKIREEGKALMDLNRRIVSETDRTPLTKEEIDSYQTRFAGAIEQAMLSLDEETRAVIGLVEKLEEKSRPVGQTVSKKLREANGEFQQIISGK
jgi:methyl-accepting chemotaxis protein